MPRIGTFKVKSLAGARGVSISWTDAGPPERIIPIGPKVFIVCIVTWLKGCISQYTPDSLMRRKISQNLN